MIVRLKNVRLSFPYLFEMQPPMPGGNGKPSFGCHLILDKDDAQVKEVSQAVRAAAKEEWGDKAESRLEALKETSANKVCLRSGKLKPDNEEYAGKVFVSARSKVQPTIVDRTKDPETGKARVLTQADGKPYGGCYVNAVIDVYAYSAHGGGVSAQLQGVQFHRDGEAFGGGRVADVDEFDAEDPDEADMDAGALTGDDDDDVPY